MCEARVPGDGSQTWIVGLARTLRSQHPQTGVAQLWSLDPQPNPPRDNAWWNVCTTQGGEVTGRTLASILY